MLTRAGYQLCIRRGVNSREARAVPTRWICCREWGEPELRGVFWSPLDSPRYQQPDTFTTSPRLWSNFYITHPLHCLAHIIIHFPFSFVWVYKTTFHTSRYGTAYWYSDFYFSQTGRYIIIVLSDRFNFVTRQKFLISLFLDIHRNCEVGNFWHCWISTVAIDSRYRVNRCSWITMCTLHHYIISSASSLVR